MSYPHVFDKAKNEYYAGGYATRFSYSNCKKCKFYQRIEGVWGCFQENEYPLPSAGPTRKKCPLCEEREKQK